MKNIILRHLNGKKIFVLFLLTNIVYLIMLTTTIPKVMSYSGGMKLLDLLPTGYTAEYVNSLLNALGSDGRNAYLFQQIPLDFIYPFLFGTTYCLLIALILKQLGKQNSILFYSSFIPILAGFFDYLENIGIITILKTYPHNSTTISQLTSMFSLLKSALTIVTFICLTVALLVLLTKYIITRNKHNKI